MDFFGTNYLRLKNDYIIPLLSDGVSRKKHEYWSLKDIITQKRRECVHWGVWQRKSRRSKLFEI